MRRRSAITRGRSAGTSMSRPFLPPAARKAFPASSTSRAASDASGATGSAPVSMRATSSRSLIAPRIRSACSTMIRWNCRISTGSRADPSSSSAVAEPRMEVRGSRSSWLAVARKSARSLPTASSSVRSWRVTT